MTRRLVDQHQVTGLGDRLEDRRGVERRERSRIDDLDLHAVGRQTLRRGQRAVDHPTCGHDGHVSPGPAHVGHAERDEVLALGDLAVLERQQDVVEETDRVVVADRRGHQALRIGGGRRQRDLQPRDAHEHPVDRTGVLPRPAGGEAVSGLQHQRHLDLTAAHGVKARRLVDHLVHRDQKELGHVQLHDRPQAGECGADREDSIAHFDGRCRHAGLGEVQQREAGHAPLCFILAGSNVRMAANGPARDPRSSNGGPAPGEGQAARIVDKSAQYANA